MSVDVERRVIESSFASAKANNSNASDVLVEGILSLPELRVNGRLVITPGSKLEVKSGLTVKNGVEMGHGSSLSVRGKVYIEEGIQTHDECTIDMYDEAWLTLIRTGYKCVLNVSGTMFCNLINIGQSNTILIDKSLGLKGNNAGACFHIGDDSRVHIGENLMRSGAVSLGNTCTFTVGKNVSADNFTLGYRSIARVYGAMEVNGIWLMSESSLLVSGKTTAATITLDKANNLEAREISVKTLKLTNTEAKIGRVTAETLRSLSSVITSNSNILVKQELDIYGKSMLEAESVTAKTLNVHDSHVKVSNLDVTNDSNILYGSHVEISKDINSMKTTLKSKSTLDVGNNMSTQALCMLPNSSVNVSNCLLVRDTIMSSPIKSQLRPEQKGLFVHSGSCLCVNSNADIHHLIEMRYDSKIVVLGNLMTNAVLSFRQSGDTYKDAKVLQGRKLSDISRRVEVAGNLMLGDETSRGRLTNVDAEITIDGDIYYDFSNTDLANDIDSLNENGLLRARGMQKDLKTNRSSGIE